jgi:DNA-binding SARP family transcriptional activator
LGELRLAQGRAADAVALQARAVQEHLSQIGPRHPDGARGHLALAQAQLRAGDDAAARQSLEAARPLLAGQHPASPARVWVASLERDLGAYRISDQDKP